MAEEKKKETTTEWFKKWGKKVFFGGLILLTLIGLAKCAGVGEKGEEASTVKATESGRKYAPAQNFSAMDGDFVPITIQVPAAGQWVPVKLKMGYDASLSPSVPMVFDYLDGRPLVHDRPGVKIDTGKIPSSFDVTGEGVGGVLTIRCYRIKTPVSSPPTPIKKEVMKVSSKKVRSAHKDLSDADVPHSVQIM